MGKINSIERYKMMKMELMDGKYMTYESFEAKISDMLKQGELTKNQYRLLLDSAKVIFIA